MPLACARLICSLGRKSETNCNCFPDLQELKFERNQNEKEMSEGRKEFSFDSGLTHTSSTDAYAFKTQMHTAFRPPFLVSSQIS